jgi:von Willebrand factor type A domain
MSDSRPPTSFEKASAPPIKSGLAVIPSWMLSLVLHGALIFVLAATLSGRSGGIVGDPNGDFRRIGIYVGHSGNGGDGTGGTGTPETTAGAKHNLVPHEPTPISPPPAPVAPPATVAPPSPAISPTSDLPVAASIPTLKPQPIIGPGTALDAPVATAENSPATSPPPHKGEAPGRAKPSSGGKWDGLSHETRGGGSGGGGGPRGSFGTAPFFGIWDAGAKFVYVIDCSGSMFSYNSMQAAKNELLSSLASLRRSQQFQIVFYNLDQKWMKAPGKVDFQYFPASESNRRLAGQFIAEVQPHGGTLHLPALELALRLHPDVIFFLTDAGEPAMKPEEMQEIRRLNGGHSRIHCVQFGMHDDAVADFLRKLAAENNGDFAYQNVKRFAESGPPPREARLSAKRVDEPNSSSLPGR